METLNQRKKPAIVLQNGKPTAVIIDIDQYEEMLEKLQDLEDLAYIEQIKSERNLEYISLEDYLKEIGEENV